MTDPDDVLLRARTQADVPDVVDLLLAQQPSTRYPFRNPLPMPAEEFVVRPGQLEAWVATSGQALVGHVGTTTVADDEVGNVWASALGVATSALGAVTTLVVDPACTGRGLGGRLLDAAEGSLLGAGLTPVLEVTGHSTAALALYDSRGWREVGHIRPRWLPEGEPAVRFLALSR